jgi:hypothetical protein
MKPPVGRGVEAFAPLGWPPLLETAPVPDRPEPPTRAPDRAEEGLRQRLAALLEVSAEFRTGIPLPELSALLPRDAPADATALERWLAERPDIARTDAGRVFAPNAPATALDEREERAIRYRTAAERLVGRDFRPLERWMRCAALTGSAAYGAPEPGDDLDLFVVTRSGTMWLFLVAATLAVRLRYRTSLADDRPRPCINFVLDERLAPVEFATRRGFLVAREALTAQVLWGDEYYRSLLVGAPWLGAEIPRMYEARCAGPLAESVPPVGRLVRGMNAAIYPVLACYLHLVGMYRNARRRRAGHPEKEFRTVVRFRRLAVPSERFDLLSAKYELRADRAHGRGYVPAARRDRDEAKRSPS